MQDSTLHRGFVDRSPERGNGTPNIVHMYVHSLGTKTISLTEEAYERLKAAKKEGESFSDVVNRISPGVRLEEYWGVLDDDAADELRETVAEGRDRRRAVRSERRNRIASELSDNAEQ